MRKTIQKAVAFAVSAALALTALVGGLSANAIEYLATSFDSVPDGYVEFDDGGYFASSNPSMDEYRTYYNGNSVHIITHSAYNCLTICIPADMYETYTEIWDTYQDEIYFTYYNEYTCVNHSTQEEEVDITILDADEIVSPDYEDILSFVDDLRESGAVLRAYYQEYDGYGASHMDYYDKVCVDYDGDDMTTDSLLAIASDYLDDPIVEMDWINESWDENTVIPYMISSSPDILTSLALINAIEDAYPEAILSLAHGPIPEESGSSSTLVDNSTNLLTLLDEDTLVDIICGDVNFDGAVNLSDVVTLSKASSGVVDITDNMTAAGDIDGDGAITEDDSLILLQFQMGLVRAIPLT